MGVHGERKAARTRELAVRHGYPVVYLLDSAGGRVNEAVGAFGGTGDLFREMSQMSGVVPQVGAVLGHCSAGTGYVPALCDFVPMVKGTSSMALAGVHLVRAATGEELTEEEMGGSAVHAKISGVADAEAADDAECLRLVRAYLSFMPSRYGDPLPVRPVSDPPDRRSEKLYEIVPANLRKAYDMRRVIKEIADDGEFFPLKADWARALITGFARFAGRPVGIVASQPMIRAGAIAVDEADKAAKFINICDAFGIPLVFLVDVPGFVVGREVEHRGILRHGAKFLHNISCATVPKVTVILRKAYGAGYYVMGGRQYEADYIVGWPTAEISIMGPEGAVNILFRRQLAAADARRGPGDAAAGPARDRARPDRSLSHGQASVLSTTSLTPPIPRGHILRLRSRKKSSWRRASNAVSSPCDMKQRPVRVRVHTLCLLRALLAQCGARCGVRSALPRLPGAAPGDRTPAGLGGGAAVRPRAEWPRSPGGIPWACPGQPGRHGGAVPGAAT